MEGRLVVVCQKPFLMGQGLISLSNLNSDINFFGLGIC